jgi:phosphatidylglycerophosphate synthase
MSFNSNYTPSYFRKNFPEWKKKKDPVLTNIFYRPLSFYIASFFAKRGISANTVSYFSTIIGFIACLMFLINNFHCQLFGAIFINVWLLLDCVDGNLARSVKKQAFGEFADAISSYILVGFMCTTMGFAVYFTGGVLVSPHCPWIILCGALGSNADSLMRLIYQKYKNIATDLEYKNIIPHEQEKRTDITQVSSLRVRIESELGVGGLLPALILICTIFNALDIVIVYCLLYHGLSFMATTIIQVRKAINLTKKYPLHNN